MPGRKSCSKHQGGQVSAATLAGLGQGSTYRPTTAHCIQQPGPGELGSLLQWQIWGIELQAEGFLSRHSTGYISHPNILVKGGETVQRGEDHWSDIENRSMMAWKQVGGPGWCQHGVEM